MPFEKDWRSRRVVHKTPGGKMTRVKISSLPAEDQQRYNPNRFDKMSGMKMTDKEAAELRRLNLDGVRSFNFYIGLEDIDALDDIKEGDLTLATNDSSTVVDLFDDDLNVVNLKNVPIEAIKVFGSPKENKNGSLDYSDIEFEEFGDIDDDRKFENIKFGKSNIYGLDITPYMDGIEVSIDDDNVDMTNEGFYNFYYRGGLL